MKGKTGELLYFLLWSADQLMRPTFRNLTGSFEDWSYRNGLSFQLTRLEKLQLLERKDSSDATRLYRLTEAGRIRALGGRDPVACWSRPWDGQWRLMLYDVPIRRNSHRNRLRNHLRSLGFGVLQGSVWISPDLPDSELEILRGGRTDVSSLIVLEARPCSGELDTEIVAAAWDFEEINRRYEEYLKFLAERPVAPLGEKKAAMSFRHWAERERQAWQGMLALDPFLPKRLLPAGYLGFQAWHRRVAALGEARQQLHTFSIS